ncbi:ferredoxin-thioredoxin reductase catalytic domain-containing protein [Mariprofundus ferrooxydans]|uniref:ferredoxin:thioredoxin reductase n=1 Tax=Mariprofundus ferrooxydans PV-1 TaxID=314345 RepID=Q0F1M4_9PROT|nr:ferredoxin-thioredoxin reductase catalytic domain-containing protein [Mariprofundus ferrooxydans]EAU55167.1 ferredoxin thioredoxin reductase, catalytic beta chain [Mariprofundus ferrooxydans PV-1]
MRQLPSEKSLDAVDRLVASYTLKSGTCTHPGPTVTESVKLGLAEHKDKLNKLLCPCRFYPDKGEEVTHRTWICPCDDMQVYKYCHCLLFFTEQGLPITEYLPSYHEGRETYGEVKDPTPDKGRPLKHRADAREDERLSRPS